VTSSAVGTERRLGGRTRRFFRRTLAALVAAGVDFLVGGAFAIERYAGLVRDTKDFDVFVRPRDRGRLLATLAAVGCETEEPYPHWLAKARCAGDVVDVIFNSGNAMCEVDDGWFAHATGGRVLGVPVRFVPAEELLWSKAFVQERERFDGADVVHLLHARGPDLDWDRLLARFGEHWRVLYAHVILFGYVFPSERRRVPRAVMAELGRRLADEARPPRGPRVCRGTLLSRTQYATEVGEGGYADARVVPLGHMTPATAASWTAAGARAAPAGAAGGERAARITRRVTHASSADGTARPSRR